MKRYLSVVLVIAMLFSVLALTSCGVDGIMLYRLNKDKDGYVVSSLVKGNLVVLDGNIIPDTYNGLPVTEIAAGGFSGWTYLLDITIPGSVEKIGRYAFGLSGLCFLTIQEGTKIIDDYAFTNSIYLVEAALPSTIEYIGAGAFGNCSSLVSISYNGTMAEWNAIEKGEGWCAFTGGEDGVLSIGCTNGVVTINAWEN